VDSVHRWSDSSLDRGAFLNANLTVGANADISIGSRAYLGPGVSLLPTSHTIGPHAQRAGANTSAPIRVGAGSWLGAGVIVLGGTSIGDGCVVAAGSVVTADCEPDAIYGGVPAKLLRRLDPEIAE
jgi:maltose O-acetyltransferase